MEQDTSHPPRRPIAPSAALFVAPEEISDDAEVIPHQTSGSAAAPVRAPFSGSKDPKSSGTPTKRITSPRPMPEQLTFGDPEPPVTSPVPTSAPVAKPFVAARSAAPESETRSESAPRATEPKRTTQPEPAKRTPRANPGLATFTPPEIPAAPALEPTTATERGKPNPAPTVRDDKSAPVRPKKATRTAAPTAEKSPITDTRRSQPHAAEEPRTEPLVPTSQVVEPKAPAAKVAKPRIAAPRVVETQVVEPRIAAPQDAAPQLGEPQVGEPQVAAPQVAVSDVVEPQAVEPLAAASEIAAPDVTLPLQVETVTPVTAKKPAKQPAEKLVKKAAKVVEARTPLNEDRPQRRVVEPEVAAPTKIEATVPAQRGTVGRTRDDLPTDAALAWAVKAQPQLTQAALAIASVARFGDSAREEADWLRRSYPKVGPAKLASVALDSARKRARYVVGAALFGGPLGLAASVSTLAVTKARLIIDVAAIFGYDPLDPARAVDVLVLLGAYPDAPAAAKAVAELTGDASGVGGEVPVARPTLIATATATLLTRAASRLLPGVGTLAQVLRTKSETEQLADRAIKYFQS